MTPTIHLVRGDASVRSRRVVVTGCAGFIGSRLCEELLRHGHEVVGVDCFTDYYATTLKHENIAALLDDGAFTLRRMDLSTDSLDDLVDGVDVVIHLAGQAGVRASFGQGFEHYLRHNVHATQRLLEAATRHPLERFVYASSSSVYGDAARYPTSEECERHPVSPYGMTKVATEDLAAVYHRLNGLPVVGLRYFTVYGPRQRPDMAFARFIARALAGQSLPIFGDGRQVRDFTFVDDIVAGTIAAAERGRFGSVYNLGGGHPVELREVITLLSDLIGRKIAVDRRPVQNGEASRTSADVSRAARELAWAPETLLPDGLAAQFDWLIAQSSARQSAALAA
jgi:UDP-glucose 4-epimerase